MQYSGNLIIIRNAFINKASVELFTYFIKLALAKCKDPLSVTSLKNKMTSTNNPKFSSRLVSL